MTLRGQLRRLILIVISAVVLSMSGAFFIFEYISYRTDTVDHIYPLAETIGIHLRPFLVVPHPANAREILATLNDSPDIVAAYLFDRNDQPFTFVKRPRPFIPAGSVNSPDNLLSPAEIGDILATASRDYHFAAGYLAVFVPIWADGEKLGTLYLVLSLEPFYRRILWWFVSAIGIAAVAVVFGTFLAMRLQQKIVAPISSLAEHMGRISVGELPGPAALPASGELKILVDGFNTMIDRVAAHDRLLAEINAGLEARVQERTTALQQSELRFRSLFDSSPISLWEEDLSGAAAILKRVKAAGVVDLAGYLSEHPEVVAECAAAVKILDVNERTLALYRAPSRGALFGSLDQIFTENSFHQFIKELVAIGSGATFCNVEGTNRDLDGNEIYVSVYMSVVPGHEHDYSRVVISVEDITTRKRVENELRAALREKELLIQEVHHRVKNNLQIISSLVNLQMKKVHDETARLQLHSTLLRIRAMALIHERLFRSPEATIQFDGFVHDLVREISAVYGATQRRIVIDVNVKSDIVEVEQMMVFAMIINELLSNALKYAFPENRSGCVVIALDSDAANHLTLRVSDDGVGLPPDFSRIRGDGLGFRLVESLTQQLHGTLEIANNHGTTVTIRT